MSGGPDSTGQSLLDQAKGAAQSVVASITGNPTDQAEAKQTKDEAAVEKDLSHSAAKVGPLTATPSGVAQDDPKRTDGAWNQNVGALKDSVGGFVGVTGLQEEGRRQNAAGKNEEAEGQVTDLGKGIGDRVGGTIGGAVAGLTGNAAQKEEAQKQHDDGKARQRGVETDLQNKQ
ncbi:hypothetical protein K491DRAFT_604241 [Lophiostoma macrostomum CBS 122681]|uniref:CsbD-like domain-containing protein n=1 Tax=Lophiostoma macrostomum CBS 122681 TaxID=1314788 RepID=A0A6A6SYJ7_9PLEO|nr:hypothetical protein K491DRAFT_604241 [Lophiostoma macrostomum CBS 122681]